MWHCKNNLKKQYRAKVVGSIPKSSNLHEVGVGREIVE